MMRALRTELGLKPEEKLENVFANHMETSYEIILSLVNKVNNLEKRIASQKPVKRLRKGPKRSPRTRVSTNESPSLSTDSHGASNQTDRVHYDARSQSLADEIGCRDSPSPNEDRRDAPGRQRIERH